MNLRVWCEFLEPGELVEAGAPELLARYGVSLGVAIPQQRLGPGLERLLGACGQAGAPVMLWLLLPEEQGYWPNAHNVSQYLDYAHRVCEWLDSRNLRADWFAVDMEPPIHQLRGLKEASPANAPGHLVNMLRENRDRTRLHAAAEQYSGLVQRLHQRGAKVLAAAGDIVATDMATGAGGFQNAMATPVTMAPFDVVSFMIYSSTVVGMTRGLATHRDMRWYIYRTLSAARAAAGRRVGVSLGVTDRGVISDRFHTGPDSLLPDVQAALAAGVQDIAVYNLEGILKATRPEAWFDMLTNAEPKIPARSLKIDLALAAARGLSRVL